MNSVKKVWPQPKKTQTENAIFNQFRHDWRRTLAARIASILRSCIAIAPDMIRTGDERPETVLTPSGVSSEIAHAKGWNRMLTPQEDCPR
jgi:hypothetical protein